MKEVIMSFETEISKYLKNRSLFTDISVSDIPKVSGLYIVETNDTNIMFSDDTTAILKYNGKNLLYKTFDLEYKFNKCKNKILYIGKAESKDGGLKGRITQLIKYSKGECDNHRGGKALWQIKEWEKYLYLYWCETQNALVAETKLLQLFSSEHPYINNEKPYNKIKYSYPLANWRK